MIKDNQKDTLAAICQFNAIYGSQRTGSSKNLSPDKNIQHAFTNKAGGARLMACASDAHHRDTVSFLQIAIHYNTARLQAYIIFVSHGIAFQ